jgi:uncharacterized protein YeaO (DUF488 family)
MTNARKLQIKRVYDAPAKADGMRVLVDRIWPRGLTKQRAAIDLWLKDVAPTTELRKWFAHDPERWPEFQKRYIAELRENRAAVDQIKKLSAAEKVTLLFSAHDAEQNQAVVLTYFLSR